MSSADFHSGTNAPYLKHLPTPKGRLWHPLQRVCEDLGLDQFLSHCDCSAVQSAVLRKCLANASVFLWRVTRHFVFVHMWFDICAVIAVIVVHRMFAVLSNGLNGKISSRSIVRNIFWFIFHPSFQD